MVLIIGGNPCSGKSTISKIIGEEYHLKVIDSDRLLERYVMNATPDMKRLYEWKSSSMLEILQKPSEQLFHELLEFYQEAVTCFQSDSFEENIIFEGAFFTPEICELLNIKCPVLYLLSTDEFYLERYPKRGYVIEMAQTEPGSVAIQNLMKRDLIFREYVYKTAKQKGYKVIDIDNQTSVQSVVEMVKGMLEYK